MRRFHHPYFRRSWRSAFAAGVAVALSVIPSLFAREFDVSIGKGGDVRWIVVADADWVAPEVWDRFDPKRFHQVRTLKQQRALAGTPAYRGARLIEEYFQKITGAPLPLITETDWDQRGQPPAVLVGPTRFSTRAFGAQLRPENLPRDGYRIRSVDGRLMIAGASSWGAFHGCAGLLEGPGGVEWFWPSALGEEVPRKPLLTFDRLDLTFVPAIAFAMSGIDEDWCRRLGMRDPEYTLRHSLGPDIYYEGRKDHPEWFPLLDGKREIPGEGPGANVFGWQPCMAAPASLERAVMAAREYFAQNPASPNFPMGSNDAVWRGCECRYCQAVDGPCDPFFDTTPFHYNGRYMRRYYHMLAHVADAIQADFPGKKVAGWAYAGMDLPPVGLKPNPNVVIQVIGTKIAWLNPELRRSEETRLARWHQMGGPLMAYDYFYQTGYIPMVTPHLHAEVARFMQKQGVTSAYAEAYATVARSGPKYWLQIKMCLDPSQDPDALLRRWFQGLFKEAAVPVRRYFDLVEQCWKDYPHHAYHTDGWGTYCFCYGTELPVLTPKAIERMDQALREAEQAVASDTVKKRVAILKDLHEATRIAADVIWRQRPYVDPSPFDDDTILRDLKDYARGAPCFDPKAWYTELLKKWKDQEGDQEGLVWHAWMDRMPKGPPLEGNRPESRLARALNGMVFPALKETLAKTGADDGKDVPPAVAKRAAGLTGRAGVPAELARHIEKMTARVLRIPRVASPTLDGKPAAECWKQTPEQGDFVRVLPEADGGAYATANLAPRNLTTFKVCHDNRNWHLLIDCRRARADTVATNMTDQIEVVLNRWPYRAPNTGGEAKLVVTVTADGKVTENSAGYGDKYWKAGSRAAVVSKPEGYVAELSIPFRSALYAPSFGRAIEFNVRRVIGSPAGETSAWVAPGNTFAWMDPVDARALTDVPCAPNTRPIDEGAQFPVNAEHFDVYELESPSRVIWPTDKEGSAGVHGGRNILIGQDFFPVQSGLQGVVEVEFRACRDTIPLMSGRRVRGQMESGGMGKCVPGLTWYRYRSGGFTDVLPAARCEGEPEQATERGRTVVRIPVTVPPDAQTARFKVVTEGNVQVWQARWQPRRPVELGVQIVAETPQLKPGHAIEVHARLTNRSGKPLENLGLRLAFPAGVDLRSQAVRVPDRLDPGQSAQALWWLVPVYAVGQADFVFVVESKGLAPQVIKVRGPVPDGPAKKERGR